MGKHRRLVDWLSRLDRLADDLETDTIADERSVTRAVADAMGAQGAAVAHSDPGRPADGVVALPVDDGSERPAWLVLTFPSPREQPPTEVLSFASARVGAALRTRAARRRRELEQEAAQLRFAVADALVGTLDADSIATALAGVIVPRLAGSVEVQGTAAPAREDGEDEIRVGDGSGAAIVIRREGGWSTDEREILTGISDVTRRALCEASIIDEHRRSRSILENSLLPAALLPVPGLQLASRYLPAGRGHQAGGDFYDALQGANGTTLIVGDVQGKGIEAATVTSLARHTLRDGALEGASPAELLRRLNRALLYGQAEQALAGGHTAVRFVTVAVALLMPAADGFDALVARAGHPPPVVVRPGGEIQFVEPRGVLLGVAESPSFEEAEVHLGLADTLVLYTDGVTEQRRNQSVFDEVQLGRMVRHHLGVVDAEAIADAIRDTVLLVSPEEVRDDIAVLVACVR